MSYIAVAVIVIWLGSSLGGCMGNLMLSDTCAWGHHTSQYNETCAKQAARYSSVAYCTDLEAMYQWDCISCLYSPKLYILDIIDGKKDDYYGYIGYQVSSPDVLLLSFRGTIWLDGDSARADLQFREVPWPEHVPGSAVHNGFLHYYKKVESRIRDIIVARLRAVPDTKLVITGHSLGGAAAIIAAVDVSDLIKPSVVYTYGSPRVGNSYFAEHIKDLNLRVFRVNHDHDLVPHLPPCTLSIWDLSCKGGKQPTHAPREVLYNRPMTRFNECSEVDGEDTSCSDRYSVLSFSIKEHLYYFGYNLPAPELLPETSVATMIIEDQYTTLV